MLLSHEVLVMEKYLKGKSRPAELVLRLWRAVLLVSVVWIPLAGVRTLRSATVPEFLACLCGLLAQVSSATAAHLVAWRAGHFARLLEHVRVLAERMEQDREACTEELVRRARLMRLVRRAIAMYLPSGCSLIVAQLCFSGPPVPTLPEPQGSAGRVLVAVNEAVKWIYSACSYFTMWLVLASLLIALDGLYAALLGRIKAAGGWRQVRGAARLHGRLLAVQAELRTLTFVPLLVMLAGAGVVPLINTFELLNGMASVFSLLTFSTLPLVFGSLSALGDRLEVRSLQVAEAAYGGVDVLVEPLAASRLRLMLIARAAGRPSGLAMRGFGPFNLQAAFSALQRWYQYLQLLMGTAS